MYNNQNDVCFDFDQDWEWLIVNDDCWNGIITNITKGDYVLVVGNESVLKVKPEINTSDVDGYFSKLLDEKSKDPRFAKIESRQRLLKVFEHHGFDVDDVNENLLNLLKTKCFRVVLTTTCDGYVEAAMREVFGDELNVLDFYDKSTTNRDFSSEINGDEFYDIKPTLYYVFGKACSKDYCKRFAYTQDDYIEMIAKWLGDNKPRRLLDYMQKKSLLAIGCKFEDWLFRFFWYTLRNNVTELDKRGQVALTLDPATSDRNLGNYLREQNVYMYPNANEFMEILSERLKNENLKGMFARNQGGIFISYAHEDSATASMLFGKLTGEKNGFNVWFDDSRLFAGNIYDERIENAINECSVFMPLLSPQVKKDIENNVVEDRYYCNKEWRLAKNRLKELKDKASKQNMVLFPVALNGYQLNSNCHSFFREFMELEKDVDVFEFSKEPIGNMIDALKKYLRNE